MPRNPKSGVKEPGDFQYAVVRIEAPVDVTRRLRDAPGLIVVYESGRLIEGGRGSVEVFAADEALAKLVQPGVTVTVLQSKEELAAHEAQVRRELEGAAGVAWIEVKGTLEKLLELLSVDGVEVEPKHLVKAGSRRWAVKAEATPDAIESLRARGFDINIVISAEEVTRRIDIFYGDEDS